MEGIIELVTTLVYHGLGRLIFGKSFDTGEVVPFWKKVFLGVVAFAIAYALIAIAAFGVNFIKN